MGETPILDYGQRMFISFNASCITAIWQQAYWDLEIFCEKFTRKTFFGCVLDFWDAFIYLRSALLGFRVTEFYGLMWVFDPYEQTKRVQSVNPG